MEWTNKFAGLIDQQQTASDGTMDLSLRNASTTSTSNATESTIHRPSKVDVDLRLEGPYFTPADPSRYQTVVCLVAGTGVSGAIAIAGAFTELQRSRDMEKEDGCSLVPAAAPAVLWQKCIIIWSVRADDWTELPFWEKSAGLEVRTHLTGEGRNRVDVKETLGSIIREGGDGRVWVYISGPKAFMENGKTVCKEAGVDVYAPSWDI